jgi:ATP-dependent DNA helicase 2 subunit 1
MLKKGKIGLVCALTRRNASPSFCALLPQEEGESGGWAEPGGFHLIPLPFADDIRAAPIEEGFRGGPPQSFTPSKLPPALSSARVSQRAKSLLMQQNHLSPSSRSGIALTHPTLTLTPVSTFPHLSQVPAQSARLSALAFHYAQLEATAFREEFNPAEFDDPTLPKNDTIRKKAGPLIKEWMKLLKEDKNADAVIVQSGSKRKPVGFALFFLSRS